MIGFNPDTSTGNKDDLPSRLEDMALDELSGCHRFLDAAEIALRTKVVASKQTC